jgi:hypothetical protein
MDKRKAFGERELGFGLDGLSHSRLNLTRGKLLSRVDPIGG